MNKDKEKAKAFYRRQAEDMRPMMSPEDAFGTEAPPSEEDWHQDMFEPYPPKAPPNKESDEV